MGSHDSLARAEFERRIASALLDAQQAEFSLFLLSAAAGRYAPTEASVKQWRIDLDHGLLWAPEHEGLLEDVKTAARDFASTRGWLVHGALAQEHKESPSALFERLDEFEATCKLIASTAPAIARRLLSESQTVDKREFIEAVERVWRTAA